jgi:hypothetical protein
MSWQFRCTRTWSRQLHKGRLGPGRQGLEVCQAELLMPPDGSIKGSKHCCGWQCRTCATAALAAAAGGGVGGLYQARQPQLFRSQRVEHQQWHMPHPHPSQAGLGQQQLEVERGGLLRKG